MKDERIVVSVPGVRSKFAEWIGTRGGVQVWNNINLSNPDAGKQFTPALQDVEVPEAHGGVNRVPYPSPNWSVARGAVVTSLDAFRFVARMIEVKRFRVGIRMGRQGLSMKCTDAASRRIHRECDRAEEKYGTSYYRFDYETQEAVIEIPEWEAR
jgi:hypothetical protein